MNVHQEDKTLFDDLFHYLTGDCKKDRNGKHLFYLYNLENGHYAFYESDGYILLDDPAIDSSFKYLFLNDPIRLKYFLNDIYFKPNNMEIIELEYMIGEIHEIGKRFNLGALKPDIACKVKIRSNKVILIDIEIQINWLSNLDDRLFEYGSCLRNANSSIETKKAQEEIKKSDEQKRAKRIFNDIIVIGLLITNTVSNNTHTNKIDLWRSGNNNNNFSPVPGFNILEINICELLDEMKRNKDVKLFNKNITRDGADWLKLIGLRFWAKKKEGSLGQYIFPKRKKNELFSKNPYINETILELIKGGDLDINGFSQLEEEFSNNYKKAYEDATKKNQLDNVYTHLLIGAKDLLQYFPIDYKYTMDEINDIMFKRTSIRIDILQEVFNYLKERGCLITEQKK